MRLPALFTLSLFTLPLLVSAQAPTNPIPIPAGTTRPIVLTIARAPAVDDAIYFTVSTKQLRIILITPDGTRVTKETAQQAGFDWGDIDATPPIGSTDAGAIGSMHFVRPGRAGRYAVEFTAPPGVQNASASAEFLSDRDKYSGAMSQAEGFHKVGPTRLTPGRNPLVIVLDRDEEAAIFDLVTPTGEELSLTLPNGRTIDNSVGKQGPISWITATRDKIDPPGAMFGISGFLLPDEGMHHVVTFEKAPQGKYEVRALKRATRVTAAFIPFGRMLKDATDAIAAPPRLPAGETQLQPYALPFDAKVSDNLTATIGIVGEALSSPQFVVHMEYRQILSRQPLRFSEPVVETVPTAFTQTAPGLYTATVIPRQPGILRVGVEVSGTRRNGQSFSEEAVLGQVTVTPVVARFLGLAEQAIDADQNGTLDRWEVTAKLEVVTPGEFEMRLHVSGANNSGALFDARKKLEAGVQTLTASLSAEQIRRHLSDGSWTIGAPQIFRPEGNTFGEFVAVPQTSMVTKVYKMVEWDRGAAYGERTITVRGIRPNASRKFRSFEVLWDVTTPGANCSWHGGLHSSDNISADQLLYGTLPAGRTPVSFVFDSALITADPKRQWTLSPWLNCESIKVPEERPLFIKLEVDPSGYDTRNEPFLLVASMARLRPGGHSTLAELAAIGKGKETMTFLATDAVQGLTLRFSGIAERNRDAVAFVTVEAAATIAPGRYFVPLAATGPDGTATTELVVDVVK
jgi:hypothetical protein